MDRIIELTLSQDMASAFGFLRDNKTLTLKKGDYIKLVYFKPYQSTLAPINKQGLTLKISHKPVLEGWQVIRSLDIATADSKLLEVLDALAVEDLQTTRQASPIVEPLVFKWLKYGLFERVDVVLFVRYLFSRGYSFEDVTDVFTTLCRRTSLAPIFLREMSKLYQGG